MGIFDEIKKALSPGARPQAGRPPSPTSRAPPVDDDAPLPEGLAKAQARRRTTGLLTRTGRTMGPGRHQGYESVERIVALRVGRFPWTDDEARRALVAAGFDPVHAEAYLKSPAARKLLE